MSRIRIDRRTFLLGAGAGLTTALLPLSSRAAEGGKVLVIGGSAMVGALGRGIEDGIAAAGHPTERAAKSSTGLARPDFYDWPAEAKRLYEAHAPIATVCMFGGNDGQGLHMGKKADPQWIRWQEEGWSAEYATRVQQFADAVAPNGEHVFWVGMPIMRAKKLDGRIQRMNEIFSAKMAERPGGHFIDTRAVMSDARGKYAEVLTVHGKRVKVRAGDGIHYTMSGATLLSEFVVPHVTEALAK